MIDLTQALYLLLALAGFIWLVTRDKRQPMKPPNSPILHKTQAQRGGKPHNAARITRQLQAQDKQFQQDNRRKAA